MKKPQFQGGIDIALKIPRDRYGQALSFYRDVLGFEMTEVHEGVTRSFFCQFGPNRLWLDQVDHFSKAEVWLEMKTDDMKAAEAYLKRSGMEFRDELEQLPADLKAHWMPDPAGTVFLLAE